MVCNTYLCLSSFGDSLEFAFFGALTSVGALFVFHRKEKEKNMKSTDFFTKPKNMLIVGGVIVLITLIVIISVVFGRANVDNNSIHKDGTNEVHDWVKATCEKAKHCSICGLESGEPKPHEWTNATCIKPKFCSICGLEDGTVGTSHSWISASCIKPKHCYNCGFEEGNIGSSHSWVHATCTKPKYCYYCGLEEGDAAGHIYYQGKCTICGAKIENIILPKIPVVTVYYSDLFQITSLSYTMERYDNNSFYLYLIYGGEKVMGAGLGTISFKILDSDGYVVYTGNIYTEKLSPGDKVRNVYEKIYYKLSYNESYTIVITNTYNK